MKTPLRFDRVVVAQPAGPELQRCARPVRTSLIRSLISAPSSELVAIFELGWILPAGIVRGRVTIHLRGTVTLNSQPDSGTLQARKLLSIDGVHLQCKRQALQHAGVKARIQCCVRKSYQQAGTATNGLKWCAAEWRPRTEMRRRIGSDSVSSGQSTVSKLLAQFAPLRTCANLEQCNTVAAW